MSDPDDLYELADAASGIPAGLPLVAGLTGFADAGSTVAQLSQYMLDTLDGEVVATFDVDTLLDYRARRPIITFDQDHIEDYEASSLTLSLMKDEIGQQFLLLSGFEPDFRWRQFTRAVLGLIERYQVSTTTWVQAIPMPVPHTRPLGVTVSGNRVDLIESLSVWKPTTQAPANALHLLEYTLAKTEHPIAGFVLLVPHYLADTEFPDAAVAALSSISAATGLIFPTDRLREEGRDFLAKVDEQVQGNHELTSLVETLEKRHDTYMEGNPLPSPLIGSDGQVPSADAIAAELEKFLSRRGDDETGPTIG
ncbi:proteasome assembly chaperone family protein [Frondihabitans australicus]|uniref:Putative ATP-grasp superfamily ATP-dependent carboligase n=1 Tax=Frondihabitans australicus TaxID=386892 RepID=A0A495IDG8_9MICO|nr:PAC2 family protein [Frondihabitans australicus]RKR74022.1 putative ATP-grasp superfamily ATP-dependent carboligase [Frondihabitans australicus]